MLTKITSAADRMMGSWIVAAALLVLLAVASITSEGNDPLAGMTEGALAAADEPAQPAFSPLGTLAALAETVDVAVVDLSEFTPPEN